jgi:hypothetical protein
MSNSDLNDAHFTARASTALLGASSFFSPCRDFAINWTVLDLTFLVLECWSDTKFATMHLLDSLIAITLLHAWATCLITVRPRRPIAELAVNRAGDDITGFSLCLWALAFLATML